MISAIYAIRRLSFLVCCNFSSQGLCSGTTGKEDLLYNVIQDAI